MIRVITTLLVFMLLPATIGAHEQTERYIPIGKSPGVSGVSSYIGTCTGYNAETHMMTVRDMDGGITVTDKTQIWVDNTAQRKTNVKAAYSALRAGVRMEVKFADGESRRVAEWIKIESPF